MHKFDYFATNIPTSIMIHVTDYLLTKNPPIDCTQNCSEATIFLKKNNYSHFAVHKNNSFSGLIALEDLRTFDADKKISDYSYAFRFIYVKENANLLEILEVFARNKTNIVAVLDGANNYLGYIAKNDFLDLFLQSSFIMEQGTTIKIVKEIQEYSMSQIAQIIESNNGKLLGAYVSDSTTDVIEVTLKIAIGAVNEIIQTFRRYNYQVVSEHKEDSYLEKLKERSDYLDKYLNI